MRIRIIDAFTDRPFAGNPAAVCLLDADTWPDEAWMQQVAAEMHLSETAFAHPLPASADADWALRWFTPEVETNLCGHATLATAHAMHRDRGTPGTVRFMSRSGVLVAHTADDGTITLDFPAAPPARCPRPTAWRQALGADPAGHLRHRRTRRPAGRPRRRGGRARRWRPDLGAIARLARRDGLRGDHRHRERPRPGRRLRLRLALLRPRRRHPRGSRHRQRPHRAGAVLVRAASAATGSPACRPPRAAASCARRSTAIASTSPATRSSCSTAR